MINSDPKGTYYNQGNRGFATILRPPEQGSFFDSALRVATKKKADREKKEQDILDLLEADDIWAPFSSTANQLLEDGINRLSTGDLSRADAMKIAVKYKNIQSQAKGMQSDHQKAMTNYKADPTINEAVAQEWRFKNIVGDGSAEHLDGIVVKGVNDEGFLYEFGGSSALYAPEVVKGLVGNLRETLTEFETDPSKSYVGPGSVRYTSEKISTLINQAFEYVPDPENGNQRVLKIKDVNVLREEGLLSSFLEDEKFNRIVQDMLWEDSGRQETEFTEEQIENKAVELINLYGAKQQKVTQSTKSESARYTVREDKTTSSGGGKGNLTDEEIEDRMTLWYNHLQSGNSELLANALNQLNGTLGVNGKDVFDMITGEGDEEMTINILTGTGGRKGRFPMSRKKMKRTFLKGSFNIINAAPNENGKVTLVLTNASDIKGLGPLSNLGLDSGNQLEIEVDPSKNDSVEFWNRIYELAMQVDGKSHYNMGEGGRLAVPETKESETKQDTTPRKGAVN